MDYVTNNVGNILKEEGNLNIAYKLNKTIGNIVINFKIRKEAGGGVYKINCKCGENIYRC